MDGATTNTTVDRRGCLNQSETKVTEVPSFRNKISLQFIAVREKAHRETSAKIHQRMQKADLALQVRSRMIMSCAMRKGL